jgi:predicted transcriptional regulator
MSEISLRKVIGSEKSSRLLLDLDDGPKDCDGLSKSLGTTQKEIFSNIELLERCHLVSEKNGVYTLTLIGELIIEKLKPIFRMEEFMNSNDGYWQNHNLDFIPPYLLNRLHNLLPCTVIQPIMSEIFDYNKEAHETSISSRSLDMTAAGLLPNSFHLFSDLIDEGVNLSLIFDSCLYNKVKRDNFDKLRKLVNSKQVALYLYPRKMHLFSFKANDSCLVLRLLTNEGTYDHKQLYCCSPSAVEWGRELFEYYLENSTQLTVI